MINLALKNEKQEALKNIWKSCKHYVIPFTSQLPLFWFDTQCPQHNDLEDDKTMLMTVCLIYNFLSIIGSCSSNEQITQISLLLVSDN